MPGWKHSPYILAVALMRAIRTSIPVVPNIPILERELEGHEGHITIEDKAISTIRRLAHNHDSSVLISNERIGKLAIRTGIGQCGELTNALQTLVKLVVLNITPNPNMRCALVAFNESKHMCCLFYDVNPPENTRTSSLPSNRGNVPFVDYIGMEKDRNTVLCDPWLGYVFYIKHENFITTYQNRCQEMRLPENILTSSSISMNFSTELVWGGHSISRLVAKSQLGMAQHSTHEARVNKYREIFRPTICKFYEYWEEEAKRSRAEGEGYYERPYIIPLEEQLSAMRNYREREYFSRIYNIISTGRIH